ncbi:hypothetical protein QE152_g782 [Popillia japonica]|uniref:Uncharacterized protein n=1 Tax=Popillia japonica TaxID=7064 RepID=A0AAW1NAE9_POPJA
MGGEVSGMVVEIEEAREDEVFKRRESLQRTPPELSKRTVGEEEESGKIMTTLESPMQAAYRDIANRTSKEVCSYKMCANIIKEAYINSSKEGPKGEKTVPYWWSDEISAKRKECTMSRRSLTKMTKKKKKNK